MGYFCQFIVKKSDENKQEKDIAYVFDIVDNVCREAVDTALVKLTDQWLEKYAHGSKIVKPLLQKPEWSHANMLKLVKVCDTFREFADMMAHHYEEMVSEPDYSKLDVGMAMELDALKLKGLYIWLKKRLDKDIKYSREDMEAVQKWLHTVSPVAKNLKDTSTAFLAYDKLTKLCAQMSKSKLLYVDIIPVNPHELPYHLYKYFNDACRTLKSISESNKK